MTAALSRWPGAVALACLVAVAGCAVAPPQGPRVTVMPSPGKPLELFAAEDQACRNYAEQTIGPDTTGATVAGSAVVGTLIGAAVGAAAGGRHDHTASGAATGLVMGTAIGANRSAANAGQAQQRYDLAYEQCMATKNNGTPQVVYRRAPAPVVVAPPYATPYATPYGAASYPPPPPVR